MQTWERFLVTVAALIIGFAVARVISDQLAKLKVPIATGDIPKVPVGAGTGSGLRIAS
jgi:hypothetical protein